MPHFYLSVRQTGEALNDSVSMDFEADDLFTVLERFQAFLKAGEFPFVDEVQAINYHPENDDLDIYYSSDGSAMTAQEIEEYNASIEAEEG